MPAVPRAARCDGATPARLGHANSYAAGRRPLQAARWLSAASFAKLSTVFDPKEFCVKSLVVVGVIACIPAIASALGVLLYWWTLGLPSAINAFNYATSFAWLAFVALGVLLVVKWCRFARTLNDDRGNSWLWLISAGYCGIVLTGFLVPGYYIHNARRFDLRIWPFGEVDPDAAITFFLLSGIAFYALALCGALLFLSLAKNTRHQSKAPAK